MSALRLPSAMVGAGGRLVAGVIADARRRQRRRHVVAAVATGVVAAVVVAVVSLGGPQPGAQTGGAFSIGSAHPVTLAAGGIAGVRFGQSPAVVAARLGRLYGPPVGAGQIPLGYRRDVCGFYSETWDGLGASSDGRRFAGQLTAWFQHSRFVGYDFGDNYLQTATQSGDGGQLPSHPMLLRTAKGLAVGDSVARGQRLYRRSFLLTTQTQGTPPNPRLDRTPIWKVTGAGGAISGGIGPIALVGDAFGKHQIGIRGINAGASPNTPCN